MAKGIVKGGRNDGGGGDFSDATALAGDIALGKTAYVATGKVEGTATPSVPFGSSDKMIGGKAVSIGSGFKAVQEEGLVLAILQYNGNIASWELVAYPNLSRTAMTEHTVTHEWSTIHFEHIIAPAPVSEVIVA